MTLFPEEWTSPCPSIKSPLRTPRGHAVLFVFAAFLEKNNKTWAVSFDAKKKKIAQPFPLHRERMHLQDIPGNPKCKFYDQNTFIH